MPRTGWQECPGVAASENYAMPNLRSFNLLQRLPVVSIGRFAGLPVAIIVARNGTFTRRLIVGTRLACTLPDNLPVIPCACRAGNAPGLAGYRCGLSGAEAGPIWSCPGSFQRSAGRFLIHSSLRRCADTAGQLHFSFICGLPACCRICANPIQPIQQTPTHFTQRNILTERDEL